MEQLGSFTDDGRLCRHPACTSNFLKLEAILFGVSSYPTTPNINDYNAGRTRTSTPLRIEDTILGSQDLDGSGKVGYDNGELLVVTTEAERATSTPLQTEHNILGTQELEGSGEVGGELLSASSEAERATSTPLEPEDSILRTQDLEGSGEVSSLDDEEFLVVNVSNSSWRLNNESALN